MELIPDKVWVEDNTVYASGTLESRRIFGVALLKLGVVDAFGAIINPHAFDTWLYKTNPPAPGQDSALQLGMEEEYGLDVCNSGDDCH